MRDLIEQPITVPEKIDALKYAIDVVPAMGWDSVHLAALKALLNEQKAVAVDAVTVDGTASAGPAE